MAQSDETQKSGSLLTSALFKGALVHLSTAEADEMGQAFARWGRDSEYMRLVDSDPPLLQSARKVKEALEKEMLADSPPGVFFLIRTNEEERLIGFLGLFGIQPSHGEAWLAIGIGERQDWGKGYGSDAVRIILRYAFTELNLHRVSLNVLSYNRRAVRSYEKAGFRLEGTLRQAVQREGQRVDVYVMGILRIEWEQNRENKNNETR